MKLICINAGFYNTKIKTQDIEDVYESKTQLNDDAKNFIIVDDAKHEIGEGRRDINCKFDNNIHMLCTNYAILKHSKHFEAVNLMLALPMNVYLNREFREEYKNKFTDKAVSYFTDSGFKTVIVKDASVYMEGAAAMLLYRNQFPGVVGLIDIGGNTVNCAVFNNGKILLDTITTLDLGIIKLERMLIDELNIQQGLNVQNYEIKSFFKSHDEIVKKVVDKHIQEIHQRLLEKKWNLKSIPIIATGGGADDLRQYLPSHFAKVVVSREPVMDNVRGLWLAGSVIYK